MNYRPFRSNDSFPTTECSKEEVIHRPIAEARNRLGPWSAGDTVTMLSITLGMLPKPSTHLYPLQCDEAVTCSFTCFIIVYMQPTNFSLEHHKFSISPTASTMLSLGTLTRGIASFLGHRMALDIPSESNIPFDSYGSRSVSPSGK